jgi:hypothetical protein
VVRPAKVSVVANKLAIARLLVPITMLAPTTLVFLDKMETVANSLPSLVTTTTSVLTIPVTPPLDVSFLLTLVTTTTIAPTTLVTLPLVADSLRLLVSTLTLALPTLVSQPPQVDVSSLLFNHAIVPL